MSGIRTATIKKFNCLKTSENISWGPWRDLVTQASWGAGDWDGRGGLVGWRVARTRLGDRHGRVRTLARPGGRVETTKPLKNQPNHEKSKKQFTTPVTGMSRENFGDGEWVQIALDQSLL